MMFKNQIFFFSLILAMVSDITFIGAQRALAQEAQPVQIYKGAIPIRRDSIGPIELSPEVLVYPGEAITVVPSGSANVNQHNYEKRRCKYFGMKCWYEKRSRTKIRGADQFEIEIGLFDERGNRSGDLIVIPKGGSVTLGNPLGGSFSQPLHIRTYISTYNTGKIDRRSCRRRPDYCSSGELRLSITTNADDRLNALAERLDGFTANSVPSLQLMSRNFIDPILLENPSRKLQIQTLLADHLPEWIKKASRASQAPLVDLIEYALPLTPDEKNRTILIDARMAALGNSGNYDQLEVAAAQAVQERSAACKPGECTVKAAEELVTALKNLATAKTEGSARNRLSDITASVAMLQKGLSVLESALNGKPISDNKDTVKEISDIYQGLSDKLMLIRTPTEISLAVQSMKRSVCLQNIYTREVARVSPSGAELFDVEQLCPV